MAATRNSASRTLSDFLFILRRDWDSWLFGSALIAYGAVSLAVPRPVAAPEVIYLLRDFQFIAAGSMLMVGGIAKILFLRVTGTILYATGLVAFSFVVLNSTKSSSTILLFALAIAGLGELKRMKRRNQWETLTMERQQRMSRATPEE